MISLYPAYAVGIRAFRVVTSDAFAQPRCYKQAIHGAKIGAWVAIGGKRIVLWERVTP